MDPLLVGILKTCAIPAAGVLFKIAILDPVKTRWDRRRIAKLYDKAGNASPEAPLPAAFEAATKPSPPEVELELQRAKLRQVLVGTELAEAQHALHRMRDIIDQQRMELTNKSAELVVLRQANDENIALKRTVAEWERKYRELAEQSMALREEYYRKLKEGEPYAKPVTNDR